MRNTVRPRHTSAFPPAAEVPSNVTDSGNQHPAAPEMFNILLALESAHGLLSVRDVAELLGKSPFTIYRMAQSGRFRR